MFTSNPSAVVIARRLLGTAAGLFLLGIILGCMSVSFEGRKQIFQHDDQTYSQTGKIEIPPGQELEIYYPVPYAGPPNLVVSSTFSECQVIEQRPDHFRVKNTMSSPREITWTARGLKGPPAIVATPPQTTPDVVPTATKP
jgi:hypothetical protein